MNIIANEILSFACDFRLSVILWLLRTFQKLKHEEEVSSWLLQNC
ncbi:hypothetical protein PU02_0228 [Bartonella ancashensis]|uniref:Uncharacterized protein n=1 Tax=Bartonella ancashensis TaxID=1318743 RepID=A0A0M4M506_9HYPH|nr:hypothetical protein PU02_0228 [Bartonella ancashensis]